MSRDKVFISYSHKDKVWLERLQTLLKPAITAGRIIPWDDTLIPTGADWEGHIRKALADTKVAVLLISPHFLASDYIMQKEFPALYAAASRGEVLLFPILLEKCLFEQTALKQVQFAHDAGQPLHSLKGAELAMRLAKLAQQIVELANGGLVTTHDQHSRDEPRIDITRLPEVDYDIVGRESELETLTKAWNEPKVQLFSVIAMGGTGKSALINRWVQDLKRQQWGGAKRVFVWSFYSQGSSANRQISSSEFFTEAGRFFEVTLTDAKGKSLSDWDKGHRLGEALHRQRTLLVLDGLEPLQEPPGTPMAGHLKDQALKSLFRTLAGGQGCLCLITTRIAVADLAPIARTAHQELELDQLSDQAGATLLRRLLLPKKTSLHQKKIVETTPEEELQAASREFGGHALALRLLGTYLAIAHEGDIRQRGEIGPLHEKDAGHAERVMLKYEQWYAGKVELDILHLLGLFDHAPDRKILNLLRFPPAIPNLTERIVNSTEAEWNQAITHLWQVGLLLEEAAGQLNTHPLVREYFGKRLREQHPEAWRAGQARISNTLETASEKGGFDDGPAGYSPEYCGVGGSEPVHDHLGFEAFAYRLAELMALSETKLPLAVGLFGNWGCGKTHFMNLIDRRMKKLALDQKGKPPNANGPWCREIVPVYFNAWHYLDTNLWASLVHEIFEGLFKHLREDEESSNRNSKKIEQLVIELQKANGAAANAAECLEIAKVEKEQALREKENAEEEAKQAAQERDKIQNAIASDLDDLGKLLFEYKDKREWKDAIKILHLREASDSYKLLVSQLAELKSLKGRLMAIFHVSFASKRRLMILALLVLCSPIISGYAVWWLTRWNEDVRQIGVVFGHLTGLMVSFGGWFGIQNQRANKFISQIEEMEEKARSQRVTVMASPDLKKKREQVAECNKKEKEALLHLEWAKEKVVKLEKELRDLHPERRIFRFIEQRAETSDYRSQLGLVSLVRRDFNELSRLFTERDTTIIPNMSDEEKALHDSLSKSIDRIVLFIDDLDRCKPDKAFEVLQAVHLLLAFPLFAVVVGVDQRCLKRTIESQFEGVISNIEAINPEKTATSLDYLEKIFHVPFHLPLMDQKGFSTLIENLATPSDAISSPKKRNPVNTPKEQNVTGSVQSSTKTETVTKQDTTNQQFEKDEKVEVQRRDDLNSVPLGDWEKEALMDYHSLIQTPRGATRLLNTYRLIRAGVTSEEWIAFQGDQEENGEFRVVMLLLAAAAGYPGYARTWFEGIRAANGLIPEHIGNSGSSGTDGQSRFWKLLNQTIRQTAAKPGTLLKWIERVERFTF